MSEAREAPELPGWRARLTGPWAAALLLLAFWGLLVASTWHKSLTFDELAHATAGYAYAHDGDYRLQPENGQLPQRVAGLGIRLGRPAPPKWDPAAWRDARVFDLGFAWFYQQGNDADAMARGGRAACALFAVALGAVVWGWARQLFGPGPAMLALLFYVLNPTVLANGALMTSDMAAALGFTAALWAWWRLLEQFTLGRLLMSALLMGGLFLAKMSAVLVVPMAVLLLGVQAVRRRPGLARVVTIGTVHAVGIGAIIWAGYGFRYAAARDGDGRLALPWEYVLGKPDPTQVLARLALTSEQQERATAIFRRHRVPAVMWLHSFVDSLADLRREVLTPEQAARLDHELSAPGDGPVARSIDFARQHRLLPEAWLYGFADVHRRSQFRSAFLNGEVSKTGWWWFFPYTLLVKMPLAGFGLLALGLAALVVRVRADRAAGWGLLPLGVLFLVYGGAALVTHLNIGHRHLLPLFGGFAVLAGGAALLPGRSARVAVLGLAGLLGAETAWRFPNYLAYFNGVVSPAQGYRHLVDSSLDWGQELPAVRDYLKRAGGGPAWFAYFGSADPDYYGIRARPLHSFLGQHVWRSPPMMILPMPAANANALIADLQQRRPEYDLLTATPFGDEVVSVWLKKPAELRLAAGTYVISATMLTPLYFEQDGPWGPWSATHEASYKELATLVRPLQADDPVARTAALNRFAPGEWPAILMRYEAYRFARLTAWLRQREPDELINGSVLVYRLRDEDLARALDGPRPED